MMATAFECCDVGAWYDDGDNRGDRGENGANHFSNDDDKFEVDQPAGIHKK